MVEPISGMRRLNSMRDIISERAPDAGLASWSGCLIAGAWSGASHFAKGCDSVADNCFYGAARLLAVPRAGRSGCCIIAA
jgi:hypothetical protein